MKLNGLKFSIKIENSEELNSLVNEINSKLLELRNFEVMVKVEEDGGLAGIKKRGYLPEGEKILQEESRIAKENEKIIGINPESYIGAEILQQIRVICELRASINEIKVQTTDIVNRLNSLSRRSK